MTTTDNKGHDRQKIKTVKAFLGQLKNIGEKTLLSEMKGNNNLTEDEQTYLRGIIASIQNELGDMPPEVWEKTNVKPYKSSDK